MGAFVEVNRTYHEAHDPCVKFRHDWHDRSSILLLGKLALFVFCFLISGAGREFFLVSSLSAPFQTQFVSPARFKDTRKSVRQLSNLRGRFYDECSVVRASLSTWRKSTHLTQIVRTSS